MMRKALLIGTPGIDLPGVAKDLSNYQQFMLSPLGGLWSPSEIVTLQNPSKNEVSEQLATLRSADYSMVIFAGHGSHPKQNGSTFIALQPGVEMNVDTLKVGAPKHTMILDCCRKLERAVLTEDVIAKADSQVLELNPLDCRKYYDQTITQCENGLVILFACEIDETAGESSTTGGHYSSALLNVVKNWRATINIDTSKNYRTLSITKAHNLAVPIVQQKTGNRQNPTSEYPRSTPHFPFGIIA